MAHREVRQRPEVPGKGIAFVFQVEFESFGRKNRRASRRLAIPFRKGQRGILKQKNSAGPPSGVTGDPKAVPVAADEECRDSSLTMPGSSG
jgi:hypothetical protein